MDERKPAGPGDLARIPAAPARPAGLRRRDYRDRGPMPPVRVDSRRAVHLLWVGLALVIVTAVVAVDGTLMFIDATRRVEGTLVNVERLNAFLSLLKDAETGQRGYLLTGDERYLEPYQDALAALWERQRELRVGLAARPGQRERLDALQPLISAKLAELHRTIELRRHEGEAAAVRVVLTDEGRALMDRIREGISEMTARERARHDARREGGGALWVLAAVGVGSAAGVALVGAALHAMSRQARTGRRDD
ncbi:MAG: CHASE3 domain-containing protein [Candidatus Rokubacteria bacterium]|nr:CHASE3 domain-containing protein [Candidatus Rokubacteria bacterium]